jgi:HD-like signal output (HDOD) protein
MSESQSLLSLIEARIARGEVALPARSQVAVRLQKALQEPDANVPQVLELIESDQALTADVLRVANSSFYRGLSAISTVRSAVVRIGSAEVLRLAIAATEKEQYRVRDPRLGELMAPLWNHAMGTAIGARWLAHRLGYRDIESEVFIAGLLHDVGKLLLVRVCDDLLRSGELGAEIPISLLTEVMQAGHCQHGAALMQHWGLPTAYHEVALNHHSDTIDSANTILLLVRLANHTCRALGIGLAHDPSLDLAATQEAFALNARDILLAELSIMLEDSFTLS